MKDNIAKNFRLEMKDSEKYVQRASTISIKQVL